MFVRVALFAFAAGLCIALPGCANPAARQQKSEVAEWQEGQIKNRPITVMGSSWGYPVPNISGWDISVNSAGEGELRFDLDTRRKFRVSPEQWSEFQKAILDEEFFDLADEYGDLLVVDGTIRTVTICAGQMVKTVRVGNLFNDAKYRAKFREAARAVRILMLVRSWFSDPEAMDFTKYDRKFVDAAGR